MEWCSTKQTVATHGVFVEGVFVEPMMGFQGAPGHALRHAGLECLLGDSVGHPTLFPHLTWFLRPCLFKTVADGVSEEGITMHVQISMGESGVWDS